MHCLQNLIRRSCPYRADIRRDGVREQNCDLQCPARRAGVHLADGEKRGVSEIQVSALGLGCMEIGGQEEGCGKLVDIPVFFLK